MAASRASRWFRWFRRIVTVVALLIGLGFVGIALTIKHYEKDVPSTADLVQYEPVEVTRIVAADGTLLGEQFLERRTAVSLSDVPQHVRFAIVAAEDARFYEHEGLNYLGMLRALSVNLRDQGARQGGSTITQQLVKNVLLTPERTYERKIREVILARQIEQELTKDQILELYLNHIYFGHGRYGIEEAARYYFAKSVKDLNLAEAALLAGLPKGPSRYSPRVNPNLALGRRTYVLDQMADKGFAGRDEVEDAKASPLLLAQIPETQEELAPEVVDEARRMLRQLLGSEAQLGGYTVETTIVPELQRAAREALRENLDDYSKRHKLTPPFRAAKGKQAPIFDGAVELDGHRIYAGLVTGHQDVSGIVEMSVGTLHGVLSIDKDSRYNPDKLKPSQFAEKGAVLRVSIAAPPDEQGIAKLRLELAPQGALVSIDVHTREIVALVGSYEGARGGLDRASYAKRQPSSTFKAFVYGYGIQSHALTPASMLETDPALVDKYKPANHQPTLSIEPMRLRPALAQSVNVAAAWSAQLLGPSSVGAFAQSAGIRSKLGPDPSIALGAYEVTPRELANAYTTFAAGGVFQPPILIKSIRDRHGRELPLPERAEERRVMSEAEAYVLTDVLSSVVKEGTGKRAQAIGRPVVGKTGTSNQAKDAWFAGYTPDLTCVVWTGFDDAKPLGYGESGARSALPAFVTFMKRAHKNLAKKDFARPAGVVEAIIDPGSGLLAHPDQEQTMRELFVEGTEPTETFDPDAESEDEQPEDADDGDGESPTTDGDTEEGEASTRVKAKHLTEETPSAPGAAENDPAASPKPPEIDAPLPEELPPF